MRRFFPVMATPFPQYALTLTFRRALEVPFSARALMQLASASSDLLMLAPSCSRTPRFRVADARSDLRPW